MDRGHILVFGHRKLPIIFILLLFSCSLVSLCFFLTLSDIWPLLHFRGKNTNGARVWLHHGYAVIITGPRRNSANAISCTASAMVHVIFKSVIRSDYMPPCVTWFCTSWCLLLWDGEGVCVCMHTEHVLFPTVLPRVYTLRKLSLNSSDAETPRRGGRGGGRISQRKVNGLFWKSVWRIRDNELFGILISAPSRVTWDAVCIATQWTKVCVLELSRRCITVELKSQEETETVMRIRLRFGTIPLRLEQSKKCEGIGTMSVWAAPVLHNWLSVALDLTYTLTHFFLHFIRNDLHFAIMMTS